GGLTNPHVLGLNAFNPLALDIQNGKPVSLAQVASVAKYSPNLANLLLAEAKLVPAQHSSPGEWKRWWTVCLIGMAVFALLVFFMRGRWSPRAARRDLAEHDRMVSEELAKLVEEPAAVS
ncbi:MAG TPA: hypothetical protein VHS57_05690, partial [Acidimicrobiales bacterium]|nr:hypothetical protein [Acidimicrobiales bacterium]